jgi:hypothetical protein
VGKTEKVEDLRLPFSPPQPTLGRKTSELDQAGFLLVQLQVELAKSLSQFSQKPLSFPSILKADDEVVSIAYHDHIALGAPPPPSLDPKIKDIVKVDIGYQGAHITPLWGPLLCRMPLAFFQHSSFQPLLDVPYYTLVPDPMLNKSVSFKTVGKVHSY